MNKTANIQLVPSKLDDIYDFFTFWSKEKSEENPPKKG